MLSKRVFEVATIDLANMGFIVISYTIEDLTDLHVTNFIDHERLGHTYVRLG
jgi:hypothetical protein